MGQALYRKHRPKSLAEVVGQEHVTHTLEEAVKQGRISHAYLFTGPRGVGKTSVARILAHQINDLPYSDDSAHMDIIEIDAASNRRIDEIRELREKVYVAPTSAKYKVYIIDEVHMLTREAFNALLKTLEEPPAHVVFVLATTDAHKLPETIVSRTQRFAFKPADNAAVKSLLGRIAKSEKLEVDDAALDLIAVHGRGSFRDSVSLLDQAASQGGRVTVTGVERLLGMPSAESIKQLQAYLAGGATTADIMTALTNLYDQGYRATSIARQLSDAYRQQLASNSLELPSEQLLALLTELVEVPVSHNPERALEITLLRAVTTGQPRVEPLQAEVIQPVEITEQPPQLDNDVKPIAQEPTTEKPKVAPKPGSMKFGSNVWPEVLKALKQSHNTLYGVVRMAQPEFGDKSLKLAFAFSFHQKRLGENSNRQKLTDIIYDLTGENVDLQCVVDKSAKPPKLSMEAPAAVAEKPAEDDLSAISNIFGKAELLES